jgi:thioredoxin-related protein
MKKFILAFILSILFISFAGFLYNAYILQKNYFNQKDLSTPLPEEGQTTKVEVPSRYINYTKEEYDKSLLENRVTVLFFTSNWCEACNNQEKMNEEVFKGLDKEGIVGLSIHILDSETTTETDALAKKFDVKKENSFVILDKKGAVAYKYVGEISSDLLKTKIQEVINK